MAEHHWTDQYANNYHDWHQVQHEGSAEFYRPLGLIETAFDTDGIYHEGRADVNALLELVVNHHLSRDQIRRRILLVWTTLRLYHVLLLARAVDKQKNMVVASEAQRRFFLIRPPGSPHRAIADASKSLVFVDRQMTNDGHLDFYRHTQNTGRTFDASQALAKLFIFPLEKNSQNKTMLRVLFVKSHQITDGLTNFTWMSHFLKLLNRPIAELEQSLQELSTPASIRTRLPLPQEDLYPRVVGSRAKRRWFWLLTLVLRHVKKPLPAAFPNPLQRRQPLKEAVAMPPTYKPYLNYGIKPPLNTFTVMARVPQSGTRRLHKWCREAGASIGAGAFVLVAMAMMSLHEERYPSEPEDSRRPFIGSFPINPRPFFQHHDAPNSMMLAFSDGVVLPFLPSSLNVESRFKVLVRQAHRQLALYQKRVKPEETDALAYMGSRGAGRVIAMNYIGALERLRSKLPEHLRDSLGKSSPQGSLPAAPNGSMATCGVSSVGRSGWKRGEFGVDGPLRDGEDAFAADYSFSKQNVRARDGEFLVGVWGDDEGIAANASFDGNAIDESLVQTWKHRMETLLGEDGKNAKL